MSAELVWKGDPGNIIAHGGLGTYTIQSIGNGFVLQAELGCPARLALGWLGEMFNNLNDAKNRAGSIEQDGAA